MNVLTFTTLFPNPAQPRHGVFVENRLRHLKEKRPEINFRIVAPVPWFPIKGKIFGEYGTFAAVPATSKRDWVNVLHPKYLVIPKIGMNLTPYTMFMTAIPDIKCMHETDFPIDLIDAHYFYPDGVVAQMIAEELNVPYVCTARGTDISLCPQYPKAKQKIKKTINEAEHVITVCRALADEMEQLKARPKALSVLRNGVDLEKFKPHPNRQALREKHGLKAFTLLSVGHLIERKGHHIAINALSVLENVDLLIAGDGPWEKELKQQVKQKKMDHRVKFLGAVPHHELPEYYSAVDALVLASSREGWANVLLESMACGTPVIATAIWGTPEVVNDESGVLVDHRTPESLAQGVKRMQEKLADENTFAFREKVRRYAEQFSWDDTSNKLADIFYNVVEKNESIKNLEEQQDESVDTKSQMRV